MLLSSTVLQARGAVPSSPVELVRNAGAMTQAVLAFLAFLSLVSWTVMFAVWRQIANATSRARRFSSDFDKTRGLEEAGVLAKKSKANALSRLFLRAMHFVTETQAANLRLGGRESVEIKAAAKETLSGTQIETLQLLMDSESSAERDRLGRLIPWLASIGSVSPLIGLLGTVLGVIDAFLGIATKGSANLTAVAPGVAQALIATAAALAVAIPATFGYNILANRLNRFDLLMESFGTSVIARLVREGRV
ncbi:MAG TPA: MotA/TolQ/ExbB proton channel family protein [Gemmatimonadaceae bacterium]